jgi:tetratricopeptide (TPR) repeat protein
MTADCKTDTGQPFWQGRLFICCVALLAYSYVFTADFIWDDDAYIIFNTQLRTLSGLGRIWLDPLVSPQYYPMVLTAFWAQFQLWGVNPFGYHLVNILLHIANGLLVWACLRRCSVPSAFLVAVLFVLHPVQVESVAWITELKNILSLFFYLLALNVYIRYSAATEEDPTARLNRFLYALSLLFFALALFSKTVSASFPAAVLLISWWQTGRIVRKDVVRMLPFFVLAAVLGLNTARLEVSQALAKGAEWDFTLLDRFLIAGRAVWFYIAKLLVPHPLVFSYPRWVIDSRSIWQYIPPLALLLLLLALWLSRERFGRGPLAAMLFFVGTLFPALGFFNFYPMRFSFVADHFQYIACIGFFALLCSSANLLLQRLIPHSCSVRLVFWGAVFMVLFFLTLEQGKTYKNNLTLFSDVISKNPNSWFGYTNRAAYYVNIGNDDLAMVDFEKSLVIKPDDPDALHGRGILYMRQKDYDRAFMDFDQSIRLRPWRVDFYKTRSSASLFTGRLDTALIDAGRVIEMEPAEVKNYLLRASIYVENENYAQAINDLNTAMTIDRNGAAVWANRGLVYYRQGLYENAIADFNKAIELKPDSPESFYNRGLAKSAMGQYEAARGDFLQARQRGYVLTDADIDSILTRK